MLLALSLAGWSFAVATASVVIALAGFLVNFLSIRGETKDRREALGDAWAREWAAQRPFVYPLLPKEGAGVRQSYLKLKNGGRGPALNVVCELTFRQDAPDQPWGGFSTGALAAGDEEAFAIGGPRLAPPWARLSGVVRYMDLVNGAYVTRFEFRTGDDGGVLELVLHPQEHTPAGADEAQP
jgi:hypothetical protein